MAFMEAPVHPDRSLVAAVGVTMSRRVRERGARIFFAVIAAVTFHPAQGVGTSLVWLGAFLLFQAVEIAVFRNGTVNRRAEAWAALGLILLSNMVFALYPLLLAIESGVVGASVGILMIGGALIHAAMASGCSRLTAGVAATPALVALAGLPVIMIVLQVPWHAVLMQTSAGLVLSWTAFVAWRRVSGDMVILEKARLEADRANQAKSDFLTMISHEIRTPLNGVMGMAQSLAQDTLTASQRHRIDILLSSGQGLNDLIAEVLDLSRIEAGLLQVETAAFDLRDTVTRSIKPFAAVANAKGLEMSISLCPGLAPAYLGDPTRVRQILHNLISNAIQLTDAGGILISASRDADGVRLSVCDSGRGVPADHLGRIFDKYAILDPVVPIPDGGAGLGLGLFMANELAVHMGGGIVATNRIPHGLCLTATLPLAIAEITRSDVLRTTDPRPATTALRVLAAEDHPVNRKVLGLLLGQINVVPTIVENGLLAVQACRDEDWDLVLMDIQMPVLDGVSAARQIADDARAAGRSPPPIVAVTANVMAHQLQEYADAGMAHCAAKPLEAGALFRIMSEALDNAEDAAADAHSRHAAVANVTKINYKGTR